VVRILHSSVVHGGFVLSRRMRELAPLYSCPRSRLCVVSDSPLRAHYATGEVSPRSKYIDSCIRKRLNPRASLILRKNFTKRLNLQHHGMGDDMAVLFAEAIVSVPYIEAINIADNNLTDTGLGPIINAVVHMKDLVDLDISYNTIGPVAASSLSTYLAKESCPLQRLVLRRADVDDGKWSCCAGANHSAVICAMRVGLQR
jgi:hypothetical protein